jgi:hypothetical protein
MNNLFDVLVAEADESTRQSERRQPFPHGELLDYK